MEKESIRHRIKRLLSSQKKEERVGKSLTVKNRLFLLKEFKEAETILFYISTEEEVDTKDMIAEALKMGKKIVLPVIVGRNLELSLFQETDKLEVGLYGIKQPSKGSIRPISNDQIDLAVVPGLAFDKKGNRLGRGKGYYDRLLKDLPHTTTKIGIAFDFQVLENLPTRPTDIPVQKLVTN